MTPTTVHSSGKSGNTDWTIVILMALGFGLVGIDRFMITTLFPVIAKDLHLDYADIGLVTGALAFAWGFAALIMGNRADRLGRRKVLTGAMVVFALLIGASGLAVGLASLILVRLTMGFADGAYTPGSIAVTLESSAPRHHGLAIGIQQMMLPLIGLGLAPLLITQLLHVIDWRWMFVLFALPGFLLAWILWRRLPKTIVVDQHRSSIADWRAVLSYRNVRIAVALMLCWLTCLMTASALLPNYLTDHVKLSFEAMGGVLSAIGLGAAVGTLFLPWLSDRIGRKPVMLLASVGGIGALWMLQSTGADPTWLFFWLFLVHFFNNAAITLTVGPLCAETVPPALMATASGVVIAVGELFGGGLAPIIAGHLAANFGIDKLLLLPMATLSLGFVLALFLIETRPVQRVK
ncbi:MAG TPA: MFS transporter [Steroidobacteraceae bacterium]|nr:MFS transporter [Steroidobacteraceae bacterium]